MKLAALIPVVLSACAPDADGPHADIDRSGALFDPDGILAVEIEVAPEHWDALRAQTRSWISIYAACLREPFPSPYTYVPATVTVDGERVENVGVRKRGFLGSLSVEKPSLRIAFDEYVRGQELDDTTDLLLNNAIQDPAYVRQCLAFRTFTSAGLPAPRCNFAQVRVNGEDLGLYVHVERVDEDFVARHFDDPRGHLYEGTYSDFRDGWTATFELDSGAVDDRRDLDAVVAALERPDAELVDALDAVVDVDQLLAFWAVEVLLTHRDGLTGNANNYFAYHDPASGRFHFIPWGPDLAFRPGDDPFGNGRLAVAAASMLPWRLYQVPATRARFDETLRALLDEVWDEDAMLAELDRLEALIAPVADPDGGRGLGASLDELRAFVRGRRAAILGELDAPPAWTPTLDEAPCLEPIGEVSGSLVTSWGTGDADAFVGGDGTLAGALDGVPLDVVDVGASARAAPDAPARARIALVAELAGDAAALVTFEVDAAHLRPGARLPIDAVTVTGSVFERPPATGAFARVAVFTDGTLELADAATTDGAPVRATFRGAVARPPF